MTFVAIPFPLTGVWTGSAIAVFLQMGFWKSFASVSIGAVIAACIMALVSKTLGDKALIIFYVFAAMFLLVMLFYVIRAIVKGKKTKNISSI